MDIGEQDSFTQFGRDSPIPIVPFDEFPWEFLRNDALDAQDAAAVTTGLTRLYEIENPTMSNATNVRCAACHLSAETRDYVQTRLQLSELDVPQRYTADSLDLSWPRRRRQQRQEHARIQLLLQPAYDHPAVVVNESAEVVRFLGAAAAPD